MQESAPSPQPGRPLAPFLVLALLFTLALPALAAYTGRPGLVPTGNVALAYNSESQPTDGSVYRSNVVSADSGEIGNLASATVPRIGTGGRTTLSFSMVATLSTAVVVITPAYETYNSTTGNYTWAIGSDVTLTAQSTYTQGSNYLSPKAYVDTDGHTQMRLLVKSISTDATLQQLVVRLN